VRGIAPDERGNGVMCIFKKIDKNIDYSAILNAGEDEKRITLIKKAPDSVLDQLITGQIITGPLAAVLRSSATTEKDKRNHNFAIKVALIAGSAGGFIANILFKIFG
jgi:hypothetical protein